MAFFLSPLRSPHRLCAPCLAIATNPPAASANQPRAISPARRTAPPHLSLSPHTSDYPAPNKPKTGTDPDRAPCSPKQPVAATKLSHSCLSALVQSPTSQTMRQPDHYHPKSLLPAPAKSSTVSLLPVASRVISHTQPPPHRQCERADLVKSRYLFQRLL